LDRRVSRLAQAQLRSNRTGQVRQKLETLIGEVDNMGFDFSTASDSTTNSLSYFSDRSEDYEKYRPIHPASAIDAILSDLDSPTCGRS
jgi:hypothetical protein